MNTIRELTPNEELIKLASQYLGMQEIIGKKNNHVIVKWFSDIGFRWIKNDETAWCSCGMNWWAMQLGLERSNKLDARSWLNVGKKIVNNPIPGDVVILYRGDPNSWTGHVGLLIGFSLYQNINMLGCNQNNEVNISTKEKTRLLGYRRLRRLVDL